MRKHFQLSADTIHSNGVIFLRGKLKFTYCNIYDGDDGPSNGDDDDIPGCNDPGGDIGDGGVGNPAGNSGSGIVGAAASAGRAEIILLQEDLKLMMVMITQVVIILVVMVILSLI